jgi:hypothetical protein
VRGEPYEKATEQSVADLERAVQLLTDHPLRFCATEIQARLTKSVFEQWAWIGGLDLDLMNRTGGPESILLAQEINRIGKEII